MGKNNSKLIEELHGSAPEKDISFDRFEVLRAIGRGAFGKVRNRKYIHNSGSIKLPIQSIAVKLCSFQLRCQTAIDEHLGYHCIKNNRHFCQFLSLINRIWVESR